MDEQLDESQEFSPWQLIFSQSKVNGAQYHGEEFFPRKWDWPRDTYFQRRLRTLKETHIRARLEIDQNLFREPSELNNEQRFHRQEDSFPISSLG